MISWDNSFSIGVAEIDGQHKQLIKMIHELNEAMRGGKSKEILGDILKGMISYVRVHFGTEEKYFRQFNYPEADAHQQEHRQFAQKVDEFAKKFHSGQLGLSIEIMEFLSNWLVKHIKGSDLKYAGCFIANGLK